MKNPHTRWFYTALGCRLTGAQTPPPPPGVPPCMHDALILPLPAITPGHRHPGAELVGNRRRRIYGATWDVLRPLGFSRPCRLEPWPGVQLFLPFSRGGVGVTPQGFSTRVPHDLRGLALAGKGVAAAVLGVKLVVVCAGVEPIPWELIVRGGGTVCTPDTLPQALYELDFPGGSE